VRAPTFLVVGAARAGTTGLVEGLREHPQVFVTEPKEPHYFAFHGMRPDFRGPGDDRLVNKVAVTTELDYLALFPSDPVHHALGDGSVSSLYYHHRAIPEVLRINPAMRIVVLLREPVSRAYSSFQYQRTLGLEDQDDFLAAVEQEASRVRDNWHHLWHYTAMSFYSDAIAAFQRALGEEQVGIWFYDDLQRDYEATLREVLDFVGAPPMPNVGNNVPRVNASGSLRFPVVHRGLSWGAGTPLLRHTARALTTYRFRESIRARLVTRSDVPEPIQHVLGPLFTEDLSRLRDLVTKRQPAWLATGGG
jgi:hypothetical protein